MGDTVGKSISMACGFDIVGIGRYSGYHKRRRNRRDSEYVASGGLVRARAADTGRVDVDGVGVIRFNALLRHAVSAAHRS